MEGFDVAVLQGTFRFNVDGFDIHGSQPESQFAFNKWLSMSSLRSPESGSCRWGP